MMKLLIKIAFSVLVMVYFTGCKNGPTIPAEQDKQAQIGIISNIGGTFEYFFANMLLRERKYTAIEHWEMDRYVESRLAFYLNKKGYKNIKIIVPTEEIILLNTQRVDLWDKKFIQEFEALKKENNLDYLIYIQSFQQLGQYRYENKYISSRNVAVTNTKFLDNNYATTVLDIYKHKFNDILKNAFVVNFQERLLSKGFFDEKKEIYDLENIEKVKAIIFELLDESVKEYVQEEFL